MLQNGVSKSDEGQLQQQDADEEETQSTTDDDNAAAKVEAWRNKREISGQLLRLEVCRDLTVVQGTALGGWVTFAWITGLQAPNFHDVALYEGVFCIQYLILSGVWFAQRFVNDWNAVQMKPILLHATKNLLDLGVNLLIRLVVWGAVVSSIIFSVMSLRILELRSVTNVVISASALANYTILLHLSGYVVQDALDYVNSLRDIKTNNVITRFTMGWCLFIIKIAVWSCSTGHLMLHLLPLTDSWLLASLTALIAYLSRRTLDVTWQEPDQLQHARLIARDSRLLIWPTFTLFLSFIFEVTRSFLKISHEYALRFLVSMSNIGAENDERLLATTDQVHKD